MAQRSRRPRPATPTPRREKLPGQEVPTINAHVRWNGGVTCHVITDAELARELGVCGPCIIVTAWAGNGRLTTARHFDLDTDGIRRAYAWYGDVLRAIDDAAEQR